MAAPTLGLCRQALRLSHRTQWLSYRQLPVSRSFSSTQRRAEDGSKPPAADQAADGEDSTPYFNDTFYSSLYSSAKDSYLQSTPSQRRALEDFSTSAMDSLGPSSDFGKDMEALIEREILSSKSELGPEYFVKPEPTPRPKEDFSTMGEPEFDTAPDEKFQHDDISSLAHGQLDVHREMREHARLAAWEMPLLSQLSRPFRAPSKSTPLQWRYTSYLGTPHPAANKVVLSFSPSSLPLSQQQRGKLIKLSGPRYDPHTDTVKMGSESFPSQAQNKRYLGSQFAALLSAARDGKDSLRDLPFDFRHARRQPTAKFPREWALTPTRRKELDERRSKGKERDELLLVDGRKVIDDVRAKEAIASASAGPAALGAGTEVKKEKERVAVPVGKKGRR